MDGSDDLVRFGVIRRYEAGETLFHEGDKADGAFIMLSGRCRVREHGDEVNVLTPGELFGEIGALAGGLRTASVEALEPVEAVFVSTEQLRDGFAASPDLFWRSLKVIVARLRDVAGRQVAYRDEHKALRDVQASLLPDLSTLSMSCGFSLAVQWLPSSYASGDYYDVIQLDERRHLIAIGDVMGHGAEASLTMAIARAQIRELARSFRRTDELLLRLDGYLRDNAPPRQGMSAIVVCFDSRERVLEYSVAGHPMPLLLRDGTARPFVSRPGIMLALPFLLGAGYERHEIELRPDDRLLLYTDGLFEVAVDPGGAMLNPEGLASLLEMSARSGGDVLATLVATIDAAAVGPADDDRTAMLMTID